MKTFYLLAVIFALSAVFIKVSSIFNKKITLKGRKPIPLKQIYELKAKQHNIDYEIFQNVYEAIEKFYGINSLLLMPEDKIELLATIDSWKMDYGAEKIEEWLKEKMGITLEGEKIETILDILLLAQETKQKTS